MGNPIKDIGNSIAQAGKVADDLFESGEERQEALTNRHEMDMINGTWLTKNIRPLTLAGLLTYWLMLLPILTSFGIDVPEQQVDAVEMLSLAAFTFYFGSKGFEKIQVIKAKESRREARHKRKLKKQK